MDVTSATAMSARADKLPGQQPMPAKRRAAEAFEALFVAEMLRHSGLGKMSEEFNGGAGEAQFSHMMTQEYARAIARTGSMGIAKHVLQSMGGAK